MDFGNVGKRDSDAKLYRMKVLEAQKKMKKKPATESKMSEDLKKKKLKQDSGGGHGVDIGEKASFGQCTFNMANILMVGINSFFAKILVAKYFLSYLIIDSTFYDRVLDCLGFLTFSNRLDGLVDFSSRFHFHPLVSVLCKRIHLIHRHPM